MGIEKRVYSLIFWVQDLLTNINESNLEEILEEIKKSELITTETGVEILCTEISIIPHIRPTSKEIISELCGRLVLNLEGNQMFIMSLLKILGFRAPIILRRLYDKGIINTENSLCCLVDYHGFICFMPEIMNLRPILWNKCAKLCSERLMADNWYLFKELIRFGWEKNSLGYVLKYDLIDDLIIMMGNPKFSIDTTIEWSDFEVPFFNNKMFPLSIAAIYDSVKCFKQLMMIGSRIPNDIVKSAIIGGNCDLVRASMIIANNNHGLISIASVYRRAIIVSWLKENCFSSELNLVENAYFNNIRQIIHSLDHQCDCSHNNEEHIICLHVAAKNGYYYLLKTLLEKGFDINIKDQFGMTPIHYACLNGQFRVARFLIKNGANIHEPNELNIFFVMVYFYIWGTIHSFICSIG